MSELITFTMCKQEQAFLDQLAQCQNLPSPPGIADRILALVEDRHATADDFAKLINMDASLAARILQLGNSPVYKQRRELYEIDRAITLIGLEATLTNALSIALVSSMQERSASNLNLQLFWQRSICAASACRLLARHYRESKTEAFFMSALLQDIGMLAFDSMDTPIYAGLSPHQGDHLQVIAHERAVVGLDHATAGAWLISNWGLPVKYCEAILASHKPTDTLLEPENVKLAHCTAVSGLIADIFFGKSINDAIQRTLSVGGVLLNLKAEVLSTLLSYLADELASMSSLFDLDLGEPEWLDRKKIMAESIINASADAEPAFI